MANTLLSISFTPLSIEKTAITNRRILSYEHKHTYFLITIAG